MAGGKKRKASRTNGSQPTNQDERTRLTINSWEDVADSGDEFQISRDKILLEEQPARKKQRKLDEEYAELVPSDEDIMELPSSDEDSEQDDEGAADSASSDGEQRREEEEEEEEGWGTSRKDYYDADAIETEADALEEEEEALRLQQKQLQSMTEEDFGFDEGDWLADGKESDGEENEDELLEKLPQIEVTEDIPPSERRRILTSRYPEFEALSKEFISLEGQYEDLSTKAQEFAVYLDSQDEEITVPRTILKWRALGAYLGVLSMYFVLLTSGKFDERGKHTTLDPVEMRRHPIMETLVRARTAWEKTKELPLSDPEPVTSATDSQVSEQNELIMKDVSAPTRQRKPEKQKLTKAEIRAAKAREAAEAEQAARLQNTKDELAQISASIVEKPSSLKKVKSKKPVDEDIDFGEVPTTDAGMQDRRKKSLAFYTSQIASKAQKRSVASRGAGGDDDIPYKERFRDKVARLNAEATARGQNNKDTLGAGSDDDETDARVAAEVRDANDEDYYQTIASKTQAKKSQKSARAAALAEAAAQGASVREVEAIGADGKRAISYQIEKNKGLTPHRKKEVRNPRVKKRLKYEEKMKKLGSIRQLYKGGEGRGGYGGEMTGIKSSIVRARKL